MAPQHDGVISNASGAAVRADLNNALAALITNSSGATAPSTTYAFQFWADTTTGQLKIRNAANSAFITLMELDGTMLMEDGSLAAPGLAFASDLDTGLSRSASNKINFSAGGAERLEIGDSEVVFNDPSNDLDFRVESNGNSHMLFVDAGNDRLGIGTSSPGRTLDVNGVIRSDGTSGGLAFGGNSSTPSEGAAIHRPANNTLAFVTNSSERMRIDSSGDIDLGIAAANNATRTVSLRSDYGSGTFFDNAALALVQDSSGSSGGHLQFLTTASGGASPTERMRIDSSGRLLVGASASSSVEAAIQAVGSNPIQAHRGTADSSGPIINLTKSRNTTYGSNTAVQDGDTLGNIRFRGDDGGDYNSTAALILAAVDGTPGSNDMPGRLVFSTTADGATNPTERMRIDSSGNVGIGITNPGYKIEVSQGSGNSVARFTGANSANLVFRNATSNVFELNAGGGDDELSFGTAGNNERMRIDSTGKVGIGVADPIQKLQLHENSSGASVISFTNNTTGDGISDGLLVGLDSTEDGLVFMKENQSIIFGTGNSERMRLTDVNPALHLGKTSYNVNEAGLSLGAAGTLEGTIEATSDGQTVMKMGRLTNDGTLIQFRQGTSQEGTISVSGNTVTYGGGHLARWSQLAGGAERIEILRGSVLSNLDEMCEWAYEAQDAVLYTEEDELPEGVSVGDVKTPAQDAGTEDNEVLNRMKVSDVEGDPNVSGVFQCWDDDDDVYTNDFYCAMTGDFVIRIAQGTTVARGDLLMSAGDGTAKPQDDDIVRSKTIAKVTSTTVSTTYSDGSYCVPCVLMAC